MRVILSICAIALSSLSASAFADPDTYPPLPALNIDIAQTSVSGASDATVPRPVVNQVQAFYAALGVPAQSVSTVELDDAGHVTPPLNYGVACIQRESPFIGKCEVDGAKAILGWIYGPDPFASPVTMTPKGRYVRFGQTYHLPANRPSSFTDDGHGQHRLGLCAEQMRRRSAVQSARHAARLRAGRGLLAARLAAGRRPLLRHDVRPACGLYAVGG